MSKYCLLLQNTLAHYSVLKIKSVISNLTDIISGNELHWCITANDQGSVQNSLSFGVWRFLIVPLTLFPK
jgi:hypothetical protein